jgi:hypothetical protein
MKSVRIRAAEVLLAATALAAGGAALAGSGQDLPTVNGDLGSCSADFTVHDSSGKPIYDAKIDVTIRYGFMNKRQTELQLGTNSDGKARFTGLPNFPKKPLEFQITSGEASRSVTDDPSTDCSAKFDLTLAAH